MPRFRIRLFAQARDLIGRDHMDLDLRDGATAADLRRGLAVAHPELASLVRHSMIAANLAFVADNAVLTQDQEIALIPPVSGG